MSGDHAHHAIAQAGPVPAKVRRILVLAVAPLLLATVVGLVALWPRGRLPERQGALGLKTMLVTGRVAAIHVSPCAGGPITSARCQTADIVVTSGPDRGITTMLELSVGAGSPD